jgi:septal ring factor EnvC (AmiA/AmiB activator)
MTPEERFDRMEHVLAGWIEQSRRDYEENRRLWRETRDQQAETDRMIKGIAAEMREGFRETEARFRDLEAQMRDTDRYLKALGEATDKRISDLVSAIGKMIAAREQAPIEGGGAGRMQR